MSQKTLIAIFNYGGGMRGIVPAQIMARIEDTTGLRMAEMADIFAGPSTGAILNAALNVPHGEDPAKPLYRARHLVAFYQRDGNKIFPPDRTREFRGIIHDFNNRTLKIGQLNSLLSHGHYDPDHLGRSLRALFGTTRLADSINSLIIPTYNIEASRLEAGEIDRGGHALWLKSIHTGTPGGVGHLTPDVSLWDAVMGSCAAPTYFPCHHMQVRFAGDSMPRDVSAIDGVIFDNPCISYLGAIRQHVPADTRLIMIVLGTGYTNRSVKKEDWNRWGALGVVDPVNDLPLINIFFHASESALMESFAAEMAGNLFVLNKPMAASKSGAAAAIDDARPENLAALVNFAEEIVEENKKTFDDICHLLVGNRDRREGDKSRLLKRSGFRHYLDAVRARKDQRNDTED